MLTFQFVIFVKKTGPYFFKTFDLRMSKAIPFHCPFSLKHPGLRLIVIPFNSDLRDDFLLVTDKLPLAKIYKLERQEKNLYCSHTVGKLGQVHF